MRRPPSIQSRTQPWTLRTPLSTSFDQVQGGKTGHQTSAPEGWIIFSGINRIVGTSDAARRPRVQFDELALKRSIKVDRALCLAQICASGSPIGINSSLRCRYKHAANSAAGADMEPLLPPGGG